MRDAENIRDVMNLGVDMLGLIFWPKSPRYVKGVHIPAGLIPDIANTQIAKGLPYVGVFVNEMPQTVITHAYNYHLSYIQLHGDESPVYIDNLRATLVPDILPEVKIIKAISVRNASDIEKWQQYEGHADLLLFDTKCPCVGGSGESFDWTILESYNGSIPFLLSGGIGPDDAQRIKAFHHPMMVGIDLNSKFEDSPALKNIEKLSIFLKELKG